MKKFSFLQHKILPSIHFPFRHVTQAPTVGSPLFYLPMKDQGNMDFLTTAAGGAVSCSINRMAFLQQQCVPQML